MCAEAAGAVLGSQRRPVTQPASVFGLRGCALSAALPLALGAAHRPLAPLAPAAVHCGHTRELDSDKTNTTAEANKIQLKLFS